MKREDHGTYPFLGPICQGCHGPGLVKVHEAILGHAADGSLCLMELQMQVVISAHLLFCWLLRELSEQLYDGCGIQKWCQLAEHVVPGPNVSDGRLV